MKNFTLAVLCLLGVGGSTFAQTTGGPDAYGYIWRTSDDPQGPTFDWIDITTQGTQITGFTDDNSVAWITLQQPFRYYWSDYTKVKPGSNGWIGFDNISNIAHCFPTLPTPGGAGDNFLAPLMTDLIFNASGSSAEAWYYDDLANNRFIISYLNVPWWSAAAPGYIGSHTFQVILDGSDSSIVYQYLDMDQLNLNDQAGCAADLAVGIENVTGNIGLQVFNEIVPADSLAVKFEYPDSVLLQIPDIAPLWNQNAFNLGQFYSNTGMLSPQAYIQNVGNADVTDNIIITSELTDLFSGVIWTQTDTLVGGLISQQAHSITYTNIGPFPSGQYYFNTTTTNASDINAGNNVVTTEVEIVDVTANPIVMTYATQQPFTGTVAWTGGGGAGTYMTPPSYPITLDSVSMYIANAGAAEDYYVTIFADDGPNNEPGTILARDTMLAGNYLLDSWVMTPLSNPVVISAGGFYIGWEHISDNTIALGTETNGPISRQSWEYVGGSWAPYRVSETTELMMNAYFTGVCGSFVSNIDAVVDVSCFGLSDGSIDLSVTGGQPNYTYVWTNGAGTSEDPSGLPAGSYSVTVTDGQGCTTNQSVTINEPAALNMGALPNDEINGADGSINLTVTGGTPPYSFNWDNGSTDEDPTGLVGGDYTCIVTDANGCMDTLLVTVNSQVGIFDVTNDFAFGIYPNPNNGQFTINLNGLKTGDVIVEVLNALGQVVHTQHATASQAIPMDLQTVGNGVYFVRITADKGVSMQRVILR